MISTCSNSFPNRFSVMYFACIGAELAFCAEMGLVHRERKETKRANVNLIAVGVYEATKNRINSC